MSEELCAEFRLLIRDENVDEFVDEPKVPQAARHLKEKPKTESTSRVPRTVRPLWDPNDEERLLERWDQVVGKPMERSQTLAREFPGRKPLAVYQKYWALKTGYKQVRVRSSKRRRVATDSKLQDAHAHVQASQAHGNDAARRFWKHLEKLYELDVGANVSAMRST